MIFTAEEITLLRSFDTSNRKAALQALMNDMNEMVRTKDNELLLLCVTILKKLGKTTDDEFEKVDFTVYDDELKEQEPDHEKQK